VWHTARGSELYEPLQLLLVFSGQLVLCGDGRHSLLFIGSGNLRVRKQEGGSSGCCSVGCSLSDVYKSIVSRVCCPVMAGLECIHESVVLVPILLRALGCVGNNGFVG
jgi:hypothetical protein